MSKYKVTSSKSLVRIVRKFWGKVPVSEREIKIFEENLLPVFWRPQIEGKHKIVYTAPISIPLHAYLRKNLTVHKIYSVLAQIVEVTKKVEMYGFYLYNLVLDEQLVYVKEMTGELYFLYEPLTSRDNSTNVYAFLNDLLAKLRCEDRGVMEEINRLKAFLKNPAHYRIADLEGYILEVYPQIYQQIPRAEKGMSGFITSSQLSYRQHYDPEKESGTTLLEEEAGTVLLQEEGTVLLRQPEVTAKLRRMRTDEMIVIGGSDFEIGKDAGADYCVKDNKAVSRHHAVICRTGMAYAIRDKNSTNHTYVNGRMLKEGRPETLQDGDVIRLADEEFQFLLEQVE